LQPVAILLNKYEEQNGKCPKGRTAIAEKGERNTYNRHQSDSHSNIYKKMEKQDRCNTITIYPAKF
jgi:hypothetical protein